MALVMTSRRSILMGLPSSYGALAFGFAILLLAVDLSSATALQGRIHMDGWTGDVAQWEHGAAPAWISVPAHQKGPTELSSRKLLQTSGATCQSCYATLLQECPTWGKYRSLCASSGSFSLSPGDAPTLCNPDSCLADLRQFSLCSGTNVTITSRVNGQTSYCDAYGGGDAPEPTSAPTSGPTPPPTTAPTSSPTSNPTPAPTSNPTSAPPTSNPTSPPPIANPTVSPTSAPTRTPSPTVRPTPAPTSPIIGDEEDPYETF